MQANSSDAEITLTAALDRFLNACRGRCLATRTLEYYAWELGRAVAWLTAAGAANLADVTPDLLRRYLAGLADRGLKSTSQHAAARALRAWLNFCERDGLLDVNPMRKVSMPKRAATLQPAVSLADVRKLLDACADAQDPLREEAIIRLLVDTGLRASELCALTVGDVAGDRVRVRHGKGGKERVVFLSPSTRRALAEYLSTRPGVAAGDALIISHETGGALTYEGLRQILARLGRRAGVDVHAHALRRTFAVESLRNGADLVRLARLMGHADLVMLQKHYLPLVEADLAAMHAGTSPAAHLDGDAGTGEGH